MLDDEDQAEAALTSQLNKLTDSKVLTSAQLAGFTREIAVQLPHPLAPLGRSAGISRGDSNRPRPSRIIQGHP